MHNVKSIISYCVSKCTSCDSFYRMDNKGEEPSQSYPNLFFMVDTYDQVYPNINYHVFNSVTLGYNAFARYQLMRFIKLKGGTLWIMLR